MKNTYTLHLQLLESFVKNIESKIKLDKNEIIDTRNVRQNALKISLTIGWISVLFVLITSSILIRYLISNNNIFYTILSTLMALLSVYIINVLSYIIFNIQVIIMIYNIYDYLRISKYKINKLMNTCDIYDGKMIIYILNEIKIMQNYDVYYRIKHIETYKMNILGKLILWIVNDAINIEHLNHMNEFINSNSKNQIHLSDNLRILYDYKIYDIQTKMKTIPVWIYALYLDYFLRQKIKQTLLKEKESLLNEISDLIAENKKLRQQNELLMNR
jgi:hypothetical protein